MEGMSSSEVEALKRKHAEELEGHVRNHNQKYTDMLTERMNAEEELMEKLREEEEKGKRQGEEIKKLQQLILNKDDEIAQLKVQHQGKYPLPVSLSLSLPLPLSLILHPLPCHVPA
eukprot:TRINITY_DN263_c0_g2_i7.p2 TRINITY_DN263_c0_g2~~TRINITY_DN263_c0_g2_i7.p2  ORF type:complete len:116 (-),score=37.44 TRINITY_DN263_c0_g2_i7:515-862(-)